MKTLFTTIHYLIIAAIVGIGLLLLATLVPIPGNIKVKIVKSGSMEPKIPTGSIVVIRPSTDLNVGDVITFGPDTKTQIPTTHRIIEVSGSGSARIFTTKGDANDAPDPTITHQSDIEGKVIFSLAYVGYVLDFGRKPLGFGLLVGVPALAVIIDELMKIWKEVRSMRKRKDPPDDAGSSSGPREESYIPEIKRMPERSPERPRVDGIRQRQRPQIVAQKRYVPLRNVSFLSAKTALVALVAFGTILGLSSAGSTMSYFIDSELSIGNLLRAGIVDINLSATTDGERRMAIASDASTAESNEESIGSKTFDITVGKGGSSLPFVYTAFGQSDDGAPSECSALMLDVMFDTYQYHGPLTSFLLPTTTELGKGTFTVLTPESSATLKPNTLCTGSIVFSSFAKGFGTTSVAFSDMARYTFKIRTDQEMIEVPKVIADEIPAPIASSTEEAIPPPLPDQTEDSTSTSTEQTVVETPSTETSSSTPAQEEQVVPQEEPEVTETITPPPSETPAPVTETSSGGDSQEAL